MTRSEIFRNNYKYQAEVRKKKQEEFNNEEEIRKLAEKLQLHPMMPKSFNAVQRANLRKFEKQVLNGRKPDISGDER